MRLIVAFLFAIYSFTAFGEVQISKDYSARSAKVKPVIKKVKLLRSHPYRFAAIRFANVDPADVVDDEDLIPQKRYRSRLEQEIDENDISDYAKTRLFLARNLAIQKYLKVHGNQV